MKVLYLISACSMIPMAMPSWAGDPYPPPAGPYGVATINTAPSYPPPPGTAVEPYGAYAPDYLFQGQVPYSQPSYYPQGTEYPPPVNGNRSFFFNPMESVSGFPSPWLNMPNNYNNGYGNSSHPLPGEYPYGTEYGYINPSMGRYTPEYGDYAHHNYEPAYGDYSYQSYPASPEYNFGPQGYPTAPQTALTYPAYPQSTYSTDTGSTYSWQNSDHGRQYTPSPNPTANSFTAPPNAQSSNRKPPPGTVASSPLTPENRGDENHRWRPTQLPSGSGMDKGIKNGQPPLFRPLSEEEKRAYQ